MNNDSMTSPVPIWIVWAIALAVFVIKIPLLSWNPAEYTDGIIQLTLWNSPVVFFPPGYTACIEAVNFFLGDLLLSGRVVSLHASSLALVVVFLWARLVLKNDRLALLAMIILALSPIFTRWSIRVMTDSLFLLLFVQCAYVFWRAWMQPQRSAWPLLLWTGLATLVRYQGLFFLPCLVALLYFRKRDAQPNTMLSGAGWALASFPWIALVTWIAMRGFGHTEQFMERGSFGIGLTALLYFNMFETFVMYWPWAVTHTVFIAGVIGWVSLSRSGPASRTFAIFTLITAGVFLLVQSAFLSFQYRYLLPLLPFWCIASAAGVGWLWNRIPIAPLRTTTLAILLANLVVMSSAVLILQRGAFGDLTAASEYFETRWTSARLMTDEIYREGVIAPKAEFFANREIEWFHPGRTDLAEGDIILLTNVYSDFEMVRDLLEERFSLQVLNNWETQSVPLLPDIMVTPRIPPMTSNPPGMGLRFTPQIYRTYALRLNAKE